MQRIRIGIQGNFGSSNHRAAELFSQRYHWQEPAIVPLTTSANVLIALQSRDIDYGTFAWETARGGLVEETQEAIRHHAFAKVDEIVLDIDHVLLKRKSEAIAPKAPLRIYSHPLALQEHRTFLQKEFEQVVLCEEADTAYAAERLAAGDYPQNSVAIAPTLCEKLYGLEILVGELPNNTGYWTRFFLIEHADRKHNE